MGIWGILEFCPLHSWFWSPWGLSNIAEVNCEKMVTQLLVNVDTPPECIGVLFWLILQNLEPFYLELGGLGHQGCSQGQHVWG